MMAVVRREVKTALLIPSRLRRSRLSWPITHPVQLSRYLVDSKRYSSAELTVGETVGIIVPMAVAALEGYSLMAGQLTYPFPRLSKFCWSKGVANRVAAAFTY